MICAKKTKTEATNDQLTTIEMVLHYNLYPGANADTNFRAAKLCYAEIKQLAATCHATKFNQIKC